MKAIPFAAALAGTLSLCCLVWGCRVPATMRPNLALITIDALRADQLECYGGRRDLGAEACGVGETGARYVWAFSTSASGAPATASLLTSRYPWQHGVRRSAATFLRRDSQTLAEVLRARGYATAAFVSSPELNRSRNFQQGFEVFDDRSGSGHGAGSHGEAALAWIARAPQPWFLWIHYSEPHGPFPNRVADAPTADYDGLYEGAIRQLDRKLSQLIAVLDAQAMPPGILLVGIHGQALGEAERRYGHGHSLGLEQIRVPLLWRPPRAGPGRSVGRRVATPVSTIDIAPTLLEAAGIARPASFQGELLPHDDPPPGSGEQATRMLFAEHPDEIAAIRGSEYVSMALSLDRDRAGSAPGNRTARLWPTGGRDSERLPEYDPPAAGGARFVRLAPGLAELAAQRARNVLSRPNR